MGIELQIDDFGTGYSSLSQLQTLDIDVLKIDQSFVQALNTNEEGIALCKAMISIGKTMKILVVAEGIETPQQLQTLQLLGCDEVQGFLISPPVPADKMAAMLQAKTLFDPVAVKLVA
jgi:EAL domain-containing protein (putative c-di-GMP-specific phosphodiesterase class I)